jgi:uroporphyrinogen-III synthase
MMPRAVGALAGRRVAVTRAPEQAAGLVALLRERGAEPVVCPTIAIQPPGSYASLDAAIRALDGYDWAAFTSANGVIAFANRLAAAGRTVPPTLRLAAVGRVTASVLAERVRAPDFVPGTALAQALGAEIEDVAGRRVLLPRGELASDALASTLRARGAMVDDVVAYRTVAGGGAADLARLVRDGGVDAILFMSASSVRQLVDALPPGPGAPPLGARRPAVICIGPETARAAAEAGLQVSAVAAEKTAGGVVDAAERWFGREEDVERR